MSILRLEDVKRETGIRAHSTIYEAIRDGTFPSPIRIGMRAVGWPSEEIELYCNARIAGLQDDDIRQLVSDMADHRLARLTQLRQKQSAMALSS